MLASDSRKIQSTQMCFKAKQLLIDGECAKNTHMSLLLSTPVVSRSGGCWWVFPSAMSHLHWARRRCNFSFACLQFWRYRLLADDFEDTYICMYWQFWRCWKILGLVFLWNKNSRRQGLANGIVSKVFNLKCNWWTSRQWRSPIFRVTRCSVDNYMARDFQRVLVFHMM